VLAALDRELKAANRMSVSEFDVLITLYNAPDRRLGMSALAGGTMLSPSGLTHLVTRLERDGLVARLPDPSDGRKFYARLTDAGDAALRAARATHNATVRTELLDRLTPTERRTLRRLWGRLEASR
jgi:DNA-binding MarR family transcriptional regulator